MKWLPLNIDHHRDIEGPTTDMLLLTGSLSGALHGAWSLDWFLKLGALHLWMACLEHGMVPSWDGFHGAWSLDWCQAWLHLLHFQSLAGSKTRADEEKNNIQTKIQQARKETCTCYGWMILRGHLFRRCAHTYTLTQTIPEHVKWNALPEDCPKVAHEMLINNWASWWVCLPHEALLVLMCSIHPNFAFLQPLLAWAQLCWMSIQPYQALLSIQPYLALLSIQPYLALLSLPSFAQLEPT